MKNSSDTIVNRTRDLPVQCLSQLRHRVPHFQSAMLNFMTNEMLGDNARYGHETTKQKTTQD
jgi:hypothetical protein